MTTPFETVHGVNRDDALMMSHQARMSKNKGCGSITVHVAPYR